MEKFKLPDTSAEKSVLKTIRLKLTTLKRLEDLSKTSNISVNRLMNECIEFALNNIATDDIRKK